ncbi:MAG: bifunctional 5,10-methylene-tetrahydrofolate dehydrogenase/5,10-methylene-tetrahydrofolate cyclohydrolase [Flavobacteriales bacterium]|nr:bifunctional 5,10-methylene-tetrahydrofolate dehydrogenase/5,10-methylene-tetrahydrofolate cyclohydrolase [Flavobacteriales bacterium]|tara:strand:+ start:77 stop:952 length:876 start_codon:yes stop_codon:yes gene_type:complete
MQLLDGKITSAKIKEEIALEVKNMLTNGDRRPHLAAILVGDNGASETYVNAKVKACELVGFNSTLIRLDENVTEVEVLNEVEKINLNSEIDGLIVQLPLPKHISEIRVTETIIPEKDVDGFHPINIGRMAINLPTFISATPAGIIELFDRYQIPTSGKHCVVIGRSHIVGSPMSILMARNTKIGNCTVTLTHSRTQNLDEICRSADILIVALGKAKFVTADMVKHGAVVVDVGITRVKSKKTKSGWKLLGDVDFDQVAPKCSFITPVPGGVGPMTIASLLKNTLLSAQNFF